LNWAALTPAQIKHAKILLWKGHCSVHQMFQKSNIDAFRAKYPDGLVISHPECNFEVCAASDYVGSTEHIVKTIKEAPEGTRWLVGTELNLVDRLAREVLPQNKIVQFMATTICMCSTMQRIDPQHLAWTLENLLEGKWSIRSRCRRTKPNWPNWHLTHVGHFLNPSIYNGVPR
jgi:quinolinate synthase